MNSYYSLLGVGARATPAAVREAFLQKALLAHPDRGGSKASLQIVMQAFETLSDPHLRAEYDLRCADILGVAAIAARPLKRKSLAKEQVMPSRYLSQTHCFHGHRHVAEADEPQESQFFGRLYHLLRSLPREHRQVMLEQRFSELQRRAFERWILSHKLRNRQGIACELPVVQSRYSICDSDARRLESLPALRKHRCHSIVRVKRQGCRYKYYFASVVMEGLQLLSKTSSDLELVLRFHSALVLIKQRATRGDSNFATNFRQSLWHTLDECGLDASGMGLRLRVSLRVLWLSSALRTATYLVPSQLDEALEAHRRLTSARGHVDQHRSNVLRHVTPHDISVRWIGLRQEFLSVMSAAGQPLVAVLSRLEALEREQKSCQERQAERWNRARMTKEDRYARHQIKLHTLRQSGQSFLVSRKRQSRKGDSKINAEKKIQRLLVRCFGRGRPLRQCEKTRWSPPETMSFVSHCPKNKI